MWYRYFQDAVDNYRRAVTRCFDVGVATRGPASAEAPQSEDGLARATRLPPPANRVYPRFAECYHSRSSRVAARSHVPRSEFRSAFISLVIDTNVPKMKKGDSQYSLSRVTSRSARLLTDSISSDEPETERLLDSQQPPVVVPARGDRRQSLTAPPSPTEYRKKRDHRHHNYMNHFHHFIHWRDIWGGEPQRAQEV